MPSAKNRKRFSDEDVEIVDLTLEEALLRSMVEQGGISTSRRSRKQRKTSNDNDTPNHPCVILLSDDDDDDDDKDDKDEDDGACSRETNDNEIEVVVPEVPTLQPVRVALAMTANSASSRRESGGRTVPRRKNMNENSKKSDDEDEDDEMEILGATNVTRLPHMRQHCTECTFVPDVDLTCTPGSKSQKLARHAADLKTNETRCDLCYCYVCDTDASSCSNWNKTDDISLRWCSLPHCLASDRGRYGRKWKQLRQDHKRNDKENEEKSTTGDSLISSSRSRRATSRITPSIARPSSRASILFPSFSQPSPSHAPDNARSRQNAAARSKQGTSVVSFLPPGEPGPWCPNHATARTSKVLTQCRNCKWHNLFKHKNYTASRYDPFTKRNVPCFNPVSDRDWCHHCGMIASTRDFGKEQAKNVRMSCAHPDVSLGTRTIPFKIRSHDPRNFKEFQGNWEIGERRGEWSHSAEQMDDDTFHHRLGKRPLLRNILTMIPVLTADKIPKSGFVCRNESWAHETNSQISANETTAILLSEQNHRLLFDQLQHFGINENNKNDETNDVLSGGITASWDKKRRSGNFTVHIFLRRGAFVDHPTLWMTPKKGITLSSLLGVWYNVLPFPLHSLTACTARESASDDCSELVIGHFLSLFDEDLPAPPAMKRQAIGKFNKAVMDKWRRGHSFVSSTGGRSGGGMCSSEDISFTGTLQRYFSDTIAEDAYMTRKQYWAAECFSWTLWSYGFVSHHRQIRKGPDFSLERRDMCPFRSYLREEDQPLLMENLMHSMRAIFHRTKTINGLMQQLENLGHKAVPPIEGLNVELLNFQRQVVGWAIERENVDGGIQSFLWTKLPMSVAGNEVSPSMYFSPVLDVVSRTPPKRVRGGLICEEMGMGKTIICLALILRNPAPVEPSSGNKFFPQSPPPTWTPRDKPSDAPKSWASICCRGTLVVCCVSLVGQWVDEAKSKLKDPGLIYCYYGGSRKRDAVFLATNSIIVTTYETLASDANYHRKKSNSSTYCPPCEQISWWRIICDESHRLKDSNTSISKSLGRLSGENKWCVTGTPINTSILDLKNQMKFVGLDHLNHLFRTFEPLSTTHTLSTSTNSTRRLSCMRSGYEESPFGGFLFLMRNIMIRHSIKQKIHGSDMDLISIPPKTERTVSVAFSAEERLEYEKLESAAMATYMDFRWKPESEFNKQYLRMMQTLMPLRMACSGGRLPQESKKTKHCKDREEYQISEGDRMECAICLDYFQEPCATRCRPVPHIFCKECIKGSISVVDESDGPCPICRQNVKIKALRPAVMPHKVEDGTMTNGSSCQSTFHSKLTVLIKELKNICDKEPGSKSLIFSQFASSIDWLKTELPLHGFQILTLSGDMPMAKRAKALRDFKMESPKTVFLLSMKAGAVGINLTHANRVFILEPALNPALESQAVGRIHRLGQTRHVEIVRLVMQDSIETRLLDVIGITQNDEQVSRGGSAGKSSNSESVADNSDEAESKTLSSTCSTSKRMKRKSTGLVIKSLRTDRRKLQTAEFDVLFGIDQISHEPIAH